MLEVISHATRSLLPHRDAGSEVQRLLLRIHEESSQESNLRNVLPSLERHKQALYRCLRDSLHHAVSAKAVTLKILNLSLMKWEYYNRRSNLTSRPFGLLVDPCNSCNLACPGCVHSRHSRALNFFDWKPGMLAADRMENFLRQFGPYAMQTFFYNYGEPLLNPATPRLIRQAKRYLMQTSISTHCSVPRLDAAAYVASGLDYMTLSIDGATQNVYGRFRVNGDLETVFRNIRSLVEAKRAAGKRTPILNWQFLAFEHNAHEIPAALKIAADLGVDEFRVTPPFDVSGDDPTILAAQVPAEKIQWNPSCEADMAANWNPFPNELDAPTIEREFATPWAKRLAPGTATPLSPGHTCHWLYKNITMDAHGRIFPCAGSPTNRSADFVFSQVNAGEQTGDVFNSPKHQNARRFLADPETYTPAQSNLDEPYCLRCEWPESQLQSDIDNSQADQYLRAAGQHLFTGESRRLLCDW